jgi:hypothetical protein
MYIAFQLINKFDEKNPIVQRIASQKVVLENLLGMLETLKDKSETEAIRNNLTSIQAIMNQITSKIDETAPQAQDTSKVIIGVKTIYSIDNETFTKLKQTIEKIRNEIIKQA